MAGQIKSVQGADALDRNYEFAALPKSGFNLSRTVLLGGVPIGREIPFLDFVMPGDKVSGGHEHELIAEQFVTPVVGDMRVNFHSYYVKFRSIDSDFEEMMVPTKINGMSSSYSVPTFSLKDIYVRIVRQMLNALYPVVITNGQVMSNGVSSFGTTIASAETYFASKTQSWVNYLKKSYSDDLLSDLMHQIAPNAMAVATAADNASRTAAYMQVLYNLFDFWCGEGSKMDYFGYTIAKHVDVDYWWSGMPNVTSIANFAGTESTHMFSDVPMSEYALRADYFIWYIHDRDNNLEPRTADLPNPRKWSSVSLFSSANITSQGIHLLALRTQHWTKDAFNSAQIDDISRHVFAPLFGEMTSDLAGYSSPASPVQGSGTASGSAVPAGGQLSLLSLSYRDFAGVDRVLECPVPQSLMKSDLRFSDNDFGDFQQLGLELFTLRKARMFERTLKRIFANGGSDIYNERFRRLYDVNIPDAELSQPQYLKGSSQTINSRQEVANSGTETTPQGTRLVTAIATGQELDRYTYFCNEFGVIITHMVVMPTSQYDVTLAQHFMIKQPDFPNPLFAAQQEELMNTVEISRIGTPISGIDNVPFGHVPYAHAWRYRANEVHGQMLSSKFDYTFARFYRGLTNDNIPKLNYQFIHCRPALPMFENSILLDGQFYGSVKCNFLVERALPSPLEVI